MNDPADTPETMLQQGRALRALARSIRRSADDVDDVVQDAFATGYTSNSGSVRAPGVLSFRMERAPCHVPLRLLFLGDRRCAVRWFAAAAGEAANVSLVVRPIGMVQLAGVLTGPPGTLEFELRDGEAWRLLQARATRAGQPPPEHAPRHRGTVGEHRFRARLWPAEGGDVVERMGIFVVRARETTTAALD